MSNNLNPKITKTATRWKTRAKQDRSDRRAISRAQLFALELLDYMETHKIKQKELAERMDVSPQQVNKILRAKANLTFETLDKIGDALGVVISSPKINVQANLLSKKAGSTMQVVHRLNTEKIAFDISTTAVTKTNALLHPTLTNMAEYQFIVGQN